jgi:hypothetical protein
MAPWVLVISSAPYSAPGAEPRARLNAPAEGRRYGNIVPCRLAKFHGTRSAGGRQPPVSNLFPYHDFGPIRVERTDRSQRHLMARIQSSGVMHCCCAC